MAKIYRGRNQGSRIDMGSAEGSSPEQSALEGCGCDPMLHQESSGIRYLDDVESTYLRKTLIRFRVSSHRLEIETGRHNGRHNETPKEERICTYCNLRAIETDFYFWLVCPKYSNMRRKYFSKYFCHWPNIPKFTTIMSNESMKKVTNLGKYITECYDRMYSNLYGDTQNCIKNISLVTLLALLYMY